MKNEPASAVVRDLRGVSILGREGAARGQTQARPPLEFIAFAYAPLSPIARLRCDAPR